MFSLKSYIKSLLKQNEGNIHELDTTLYDKFYAENAEFIDAKIIEIWEQFKYEQEQASENKNHYSSN